MSKYIVCFVLVAIFMNSCSSEPKKPKVHTVEIKDMKFVPEEITVNVGDTVLWINKDIVAHDVTEESTNAWTSSVIPSDSSWKKAITEDVDYYCSIHVIMKGKIKVN